MQLAVRGQVHDALIYIPSHGCRRQMQMAAAGANIQTAIPAGDGQANLTFKPEPEPRFPFRPDCVIVADMLRTAEGC